MSAKELEEWLKSDESEGAGWGGESGETVGHNSGRNIVDILKRNPKKDPSKYTEDDLAHMRKVVSYCKRHLAQEDSLKQRKSKEELEQTKSTKSLKSESRRRAFSYLVEFQLSDKTSTDRPGILLAQTGATIPSRTTNYLGIAALCVSSATKYIPLIPFLN